MRRVYKFRLWLINLCHYICSRRCSLTGHHQLRIVVSIVMIKQTYYKILIFQIFLTKVNIKRLKPLESPEGYKAFSNSHHNSGQYNNQSNRVKYSNRLVFSGGIHRLF